jgi:hypothetical protein
MAKSGSWICSLVSVVCAALLLSCGNGNSTPRATQSVVVSPTSATSQNPTQVQFTATAYYTAAPYSITQPTGTTWGVCYQGTPTTAVTISSTGLAECGASAAGTYSIFAEAPQVSSGAVCNVVGPCGQSCGVVTGYAQLTCGK